MDRIIQDFSEAINNKRKLEVELSPPKKVITIEPHLIATDILTGELICRAWVFYNDESFWQNFTIENMKVNKITDEYFTIRESFRDETPENIKVIAIVE